MKRNIYTFLLAVIFTAYNAQDLGKISIRTANTTIPKFIASLNGVRLNNDYTNTISFNYLDDYSYRVKLLLSGSSTVLNYTLSSEPKYLSKYVVTKDNFGNYNIILESKSLMLDEEVAPQTTPSVPTNTIQPVATPKVGLTPASNEPAVKPAPTTTFAPPPGGLSGTTTAVTNTITAMTAQDFNDRCDAVKKESFDDDKLKRAKQVFDEEYFTTSQVITVVKLFSFDDKKLAFAKYAYNKTIDKKNYYKVNDALTFTRSKNELSEYIKKQPK
ncbi:MAG: DUF4476 domain-containing protein [Bacteroidia bacterium]|nr:DUF4476 domain-containing protein [Bacteroidia bacterium]